MIVWHSREFLCRVVLRDRLPEPATSQRQGKWSPATVFWLRSPNLFASHKDVCAIILKPAMREPLQDRQPKKKPTLLSSLLLAKSSPSPSSTGLGYHRDDSVNWQKWSCSKISVGPVLWNFCPISLFSGLGGHACHLIYEEVEARGFYVSQGLWHQASVTTL